ncbi:fumarylacetoacetate hydrolase family protein [Amycolatopsis sp. PS_44_ISF1]|uniref:fumarylacetoacetate hydrolase family protein n=1 Tax=Amycolatopsis sp. PS_44_ISF1 TaxID=2974917 RepID=UPI0028DFB851|nr:fumarylacetoacetate hydrolase family protein [Amycolatopsis sp. PS_44_ISF1]MDT8914998.1 fumarylacetoacetate hydrolase family protein [Amycolatopsis sp. PS_44_ISF1]
MRFMTFSDNGTERLGIAADGRLYALPKGTTLLGLLQEGGEALRRAGEGALKERDEVLSPEDLVVLAPIPTPPTVRDYTTFEQHVEGVIRLADPGAAVPEQWYAAPIFYFTNPYATLGPYDDVPLPPGETRFDFELEIAAVAGGPGRDLGVSEAEELIAGYTILNDWSGRSVQFQEMTVRLGPSKGKDSATSMGPWFVTPDELAPFRQGTSFDLRMRASVNDELIGADTWSNMAFGYGQMIAYASRGTQVRPGDVFGSGTAGHGCLAEAWGHKGFDAHPPLTPGDVVTLEVEQLGVQRSKVVDRPEPARDVEIYRSRSARNPLGR